MKTGIKLWAVAAALTATACGGPADETRNAAGPGASGNAATNVAAAEPRPASPPAANGSATAAADLTLGPNGLEPGIAFGMKQEDAITAATAAFGAPDKTEHNDECGEGPMDFASFGGLQLAFQDGRLAGWALSETQPPLRTRGGLTVGSPRRALGSLEIDEESSLGPEFDSGGVGGVLDEQGARVIALWAGHTCQFR